LKTIFIEKYRKETTSENDIRKDVEALEGDLDWKKQALDRENWK